MRKETLLARRWHVSGVIEMSFGSFVDGALAPLFPRWAASRMVARMGMEQLRQYDAAANNRATRNWRRPSTTGDREIGQSLVRLRDGARELTRNNKFASNIVKQLTAQIVGDGITAQAQHDDPAIQKAAQDEWDEWASSKVYEGRHDFFHVQKMVVRGMIEGGETLQMWLPEGDEPYAYVDVLEGDLLDHSKTQRLNDGFIIQGVEYANNRKRRGYWLYDNHPGAAIFSTNYKSSFVSADYVDHIFDQQRSPQARGISWLSHVMIDLRDMKDISNAHRLKEKVAACLALIFETDNDSQGPVAFGQQEAQPNNEPPLEFVEPGMIKRLRPGEKAKMLSPTITTDSVNLMRFEIGGIAAGLLPYYMITGDVSGANYTALRALHLIHGALLDDAQQQILIPLSCQSAFEKRMRVRALRSGDSRFLKVKAAWAVPKRPMLDPLKELMAELLEIRAGLKTLVAAHTQRGLNTDKVLQEIKRVDDIIDKLGIAIQSDPRRVTDAGILQSAAGYLAAKGDGTASTGQ
jgi:lambda family phage portal protein